MLRTILQYFCKHEYEVIFHTYYKDISFGLPGEARTEYVLKCPKCKKKIKNDRYGKWLPQQCIEVES